jgi:hypothetical protein
MSSGVFGNVLTKSILGAFVPSVKVVRRMLSTKPGVLAAKAASTLATIV